jgi:outer membrane protein assembly factor BamB
MRPNPLRSLLIVCALALAARTSAETENWPGWRGPRGDGTSLERNLPVHWSATSNVVWKSEVPGLGHASPIVWDDRIFTVSCTPETEERLLLCFDRRDGKLLWRRAVIKSPLERKHRLNSHASSTPATDGQLVYVAFLDVQEMAVAAYDFAGNQKWLARPGAFKSVHGFCSSPVLWRDKVIVNGDHDGDSWIAALDRATGRTLWKTPRPNKTRSYCVPTIYKLSGRNQMVLSGDKSVASYDPDTGKLHWYLNGPTDQFVASLVYNPGADLLFVTGGFPEHHLLGLRHDGRGTIGEAQIAWHHTKASMVSYVPSPVSAGAYFLVISDPGFANCLDAKSGELLWQEKLGSHHASLVTADGLVYFVADNGTTTVVKPGPRFEAVARNELADTIFASPAISRGQIFLRGEQSLYCIGAGKSRVARRK